MNKLVERDAGIVVDVRSILSEVQKLNRAMLALESRLTGLLAQLELPALDTPTDKAKVDHCDHDAAQPGRETGCLARNAATDGSSLDQGGNPVAVAAAGAVKPKMSDDPGALDAAPDGDSHRDSDLVLDDAKLALPMAADDFTLIRGIDAKTVKFLRELGLDRFADIAAFTPEDVMLVGEAVGNPLQMSEQNWIEQAAVLARGENTAFARSRIDSPASAPETVAESLKTTPGELDTHASTDLIAPPAGVVDSASELDARRHKRSAGWTRRIAAAACISAVAIGLLAITQLEGRVPLMAALQADTPRPAPHLASAVND